MSATNGTILVLAGVVALGFDGLIAAHNGQERHFLGIGGCVIGLIGAIQFIAGLAGIARSPGKVPSAAPGTSSPATPS